MKTETTEQTNPFTILIASIAKKDKDIGKHFKDVKSPLPDKKEVVEEEPKKKKRIKIK